MGERREIILANFEDLMLFLTFMNILPSSWQDDVWILEDCGNWVRRE